MSSNVVRKISVSTFENLDGSNFTTAGLDFSKAVGSGNVSIYAGVYTKFDEDFVKYVVDGKASLPYGDSIFSGGIRLRNKLGDNQYSFEARLQPCTVTIPVGDNTKLYATPYALAKIDCANGENSLKAGCFAGVSQKVGNTTVFLEGQIYDVTNINAGTTSVNVGISVPINLQ